MMVAYTAGVAELEPTEPYPNVSSDVRAVVNLFGVTDVGSWQITDEKGNPLGQSRCRRRCSRRPAARRPSN